MMSATNFKMTLLFFGLFFICSSAIGNNVQISNITYDESNNSINFDISWDNAFNISSIWYDHVYICKI
jgi:hypothetical protein